MIDSQINTTPTQSISEGGGYSRLAHDHNPDQTSARLDPNSRGQELAQARLGSYWQTTSLEELKSKGILSQSTIQPKSGDEVEVDKFTLANGNELSIAPDLGATILDLNFKGQKIISSDLSNESEDATRVSTMQGMPIISPPNRTTNKIYFPPKVPGKKPKVLNLGGFLSWFRFRRKKFFELDDGNIIHGRLFRNHWQLDKAESDENSNLRLTYKFNTKDDKYMFKRFGEAEYKVTYTLINHPDRPELKVDLGVVNLGNEKSKHKGVYPLVGLGLHPYFVADDDAHFKFSADTVYDTDESAIPTGEMSKPGDIGIKSDEWNKVGDTDMGMGHVFTDLRTNSETHGHRSEIQRKDGTVFIDQSPEFKHLTIFNAIEGKLCIEPQTCATNASHEEFVRGNKKANAKFLKPGESFSGSVSISYLAS